jgi:probable rRNA maturation factor
MIRVVVAKSVQHAGISPVKTKRIVRMVLRKEGMLRGSISVIFIGDDAMRKLNAQYLNHHTNTDVITFPFDRGKATVETEVYINTHQAVRQARVYNVTPHNELTRLIVHGTLHALGYSDGSTKDRKLMFEKQEEYVAELE